MQERTSRRAMSRRTQQLMHQCTRAQVELYLLEVHARHVYMLGEPDRIACFVWYCENRLHKHINMCMNDGNLFWKIIWCLMEPANSTEQMEKLQGVMSEFETKSHKSYSMLSQWSAHQMSIRSSLLHVRCVYMLWEHPNDEMMSFGPYVNNKLDKHVELCMQNSVLYQLVVRCMYCKPKSYAHWEAVEAVVDYLKDVYNESFVDV